MIRSSFALAVVACGSLVVSVMVPWVASGSGSTMTGLELSTALRQGRFVPDEMRSSAWIILAVPFLACVVLIVAGVRRWWVGLVKAAVGVVLLSGVGLASTAGFPPSAWSTGPVLVLVAALLLVSSGMLQLSTFGRFP